MCPWQNPAAMVVHADNQGLHSCCLQPLLPILVPMIIYVSASGSATTEAPEDDPQSQAWAPHKF